jgi:predicted nucleotidyltransferase component of viral defense system
MIEADEVRAAAARWGTASDQILKDHLISHLLNALRDVDGIVFYGGTALNRTYLSDRLSEDIDLYLDPRAPAAPDKVIALLLSRNKREFPDLQVEAAVGEGYVRTYSATTETHRVQIEFVGPRPEHRSIEVHRSGIDLRYSDLPDSLSLVTPTLVAFYALKAAAFEERHLERDLFDLAGLARVDAINRNALEALRAFRGGGPTQWMYQDDRAPEPRAWTVALAHQTGVLGDPRQALASVREALAAAGAWSTNS